MRIQQEVNQTCRILTQRRTRLQQLGRGKTPLYAWLRRAAGDRPHVEYPPDQIELRGVAGAEKLAAIARAAALGRWAILVRALPDGDEQLRAQRPKRIAGGRRLQPKRRSGGDQFALVSGQRRDPVGAMAQNPHRAAALIHRKLPARKQIAEIHRQRRQNPGIRRAKPAAQRADAARQVRVATIDTSKWFFADETRLESVS